MASKRIFLGLDVGAKRVGVAVADSIAKIAQPLTTLEVGEQTTQQLRDILATHGVTDVIVGRPRNQSGETTVQTVAVESFVAAYLAEPTYSIYWQDESVTSVMAEDRLKARKKPYTKKDIDAEAAAIILQDYLETL